MITNSVLKSPTKLEGTRVVLFHETYKLLEYTKSVAPEAAFISIKAVLR
jgi:hypothetical protein